MKRQVDRLVSLTCLVDLLSIIPVDYRVRTFMLQNQVVKKTYQKTLDKSTQIAQI